MEMISFYYISFIKNCGKLDAILLGSISNCIRFVCLIFKGGETSKTSKICLLDVLERVESILKSTERKRIMI